MAIGRDEKDKIGSSGQGSRVFRRPMSIISALSVGYVSSNTIYTSRTISTTKPSLPIKASLPEISGAGIGIAGWAPLGHQSTLFILWASASNQPCCLISLMIGGFLFHISLFCLLDSLMLSSCLVPLCRSTHVDKSSCGPYCRNSASALLTLSLFHHVSCRTHVLLLPVSLCWALPPANRPSLCRPLAGLGL